MRSAVVLLFVFFSIQCFAGDNPHEVMGQFILREWLEFMPADAFNTNGPGPTLTPKTVRQNHVRTATLYQSSWNHGYIGDDDTIVHSVLRFDTTGRLTELQTKTEIWKYAYDSAFTHYPSAVFIYSAIREGVLKKKNTFRYDAYGNPVEHVQHELEDTVPGRMNPLITTFTYREKQQYAYAEIRQTGKVWATYRYNSTAAIIEEQNEVLTKDKSFRYTCNYDEFVCAGEHCRGDLSMLTGIDTLCRTRMFSTQKEEEEEFSAIHYSRDAQGRLTEVHQAYETWSYVYDQHVLPVKSVWREFMEPAWPRRHMFFEYTRY